jgi:hypothetical protein
MNNPDLIINYSPNATLRYATLRYATLRYAPLPKKKIQKKLPKQKFAKINCKNQKKLNDF